MAKAMMVISLVLEKIYEMLSEVKKPSVVVEASIKTIANKARIAVSQLFLIAPNLKKLAMVIPALLSVAPANSAHFALPTHDLHRSQ